MKRFTLALLPLVLALFPVGCSSVIEKKAVDDLQATHDLIFPEYVKLVEKEHAGDKAKIENRKKLVQSANDIVGGMRKAME